MVVCRGVGGGCGEKTQLLGGGCGLLGGNDHDIVHCHRFWNSMLVLNIYKKTLYSLVQNNSI